MYNLLLEDCNDGKINWVSHVKALLDNFGFSNMSVNPIQVGPFFHKFFKQRVIDNFTQQWHNEVAIMHPLALYKHFKISIQLESYLNVLPFKLRSALSKLRLSSHTLAIETGRYANARIEPNLRFCNLCKNPNDIEDEYHFVIVCPIYNEIRKKYISNYYTRNPSVFKFINLMQEKRPCIIKKLSKFIFEAFKLRSALITSQ